MRKQVKNKDAVFPMPVLMVATYNEDGTVDVMNAAWGTMLQPDHIILNLTETHKTVKNICRNKAFTVSLADVKHMKEADFFGIISGNDTPNKFEKSGLTFTNSEIVRAPIINEFPVCMECKLVENKSNWGIVGEIKGVSATEEVMTDDKVDISLLKAICYDPFTHGYYEIGQKVGNAFNEGNELN